MARLTLVGLAVLLLIGLVVLGVKALFASLGSDKTVAAVASPAESPAPAGPSPSSTRVPTLRIICAADRCPVFVRIPGGNVLTDEDLAKGDQAAYFDPELDVVLEDAGTVRVIENGRSRPPATMGKREAFKVRRSPDP